VGPEAAENGGAVEVCTDELRPENGSDAFDNPVDLLLG
jgi:hypothetical protein